ncbi:hypothetical protein FIBSPDRAFT_421602 [Athelia psychrophila]|uniref:Uncharacterized protein n=1 Tax=Athelia psychrophila TaxID=1759441 RepID=A0A167URM9_9AGAM|nr:hypothetical protein FIBSPDRAFT_421602 [Fibularhizoctonia sp. CBS 109695]
MACAFIWLGPLEHDAVQSYNSRKRPQRWRALSRKLPTMTTSMNTLVGFGAGCAGERHDTPRSCSIGSLTKSATGRTGPVARMCFHMWSTFWKSVRCAYIAPSCSWCSSALCVSTLRTSRRC